jgi:hypothetical protein
LSKDRQRLVIVVQPLLLLSQIVVLGAEVVQTAGLAGTIAERTIDR